MSRIQIGLKQAIFEVIGGFITTIVINAFISSGVLPQDIILLINIILIVENFVLIFSMRSWGIFFTIGWLFGTFIFLESGLLKANDFLVYFLCPLIFIVVRILVLGRRSRYV